MKVNKVIIEYVGWIALILALSELASRFYLGLGDPPLFIADNQIEYMFKPSSSYQRFGNSISYNKFSMRSNDLSYYKKNSKELRVFMIGDSILNGGVQVDQNKIASKILESKLNNSLNRPVIVSNISTPSWGPPNQLAYIKRYGFFDADIVVIVMSSHDYIDVPSSKSIVGVDPNFPSHKPVFALEEAIIRYLPRLVGLRKYDSDPSFSLIDNQQNITVATSALKEMITLARLSRADVIAVQHLEKLELQEGVHKGYKVISDLLNSLNVPTYQTKGLFKQAVIAGNNPYRDNIHPNTLGQKLIAETLIEPLILRLREKSSVQ